MRALSKKILISVLSIAFVLCGVFSVSAFNKTAKAEGEISISGLTLSEWSKANSNSATLYIDVTSGNLDTTVANWLWNGLEVYLNGTIMDKNTYSCYPGSASLLVITGMTAASGDKVEIKKGASFTTNSGAYIFAENFSAAYDGSAWSVVESEETLSGLTLSDWSKANSNATTLYVDVTSGNLDTTVANWLWNGLEVYLNGSIMDKNTYSCYPGSASLLVITGMTAVNGDKVEIKKGANFTTASGKYVFAEDFIAVYGASKWVVPSDDIVVSGLTLSEWGKANSNATTLYIDVTSGNLDITVANWLWNGLEIYLNGTIMDKNIYSCYPGSASLLVITNMTAKIGDKVEIKKDANFTLENGTKYVFGDGCCYYYTGSEWTNVAPSTIKKIIDGVETDEITFGDYTLPTETKENNIFLGWSVDGELKAAGDILTGNVDGYTIIAQFADFKQVNGASIKIADTVNGSGIRFTARLAEKNEFIVKVGVLIMPKQLMTKGEFTAENYTENKDYLRFETVASEFLEKENFSDQGEAYYLKATLVKLYESNYTREFTARSYITVQYGETEKIIYAAYDETEHTRSIQTVAQKAVDAGAYSADHPIISQYLAAGKANTFAYFGPNATEEEFDEYAATGMNTVWLDTVPYRYHDRYVAKTASEENEYYAASPLKAAMELARKKV